MALDFSVLARWYLILGTQYLVYGIPAPGTWYLVSLISKIPCIWFLMLGTWYMVLGFLYLVYGILHMVIGTWFLCLNHTCYLCNWYLWNRSLHLVLCDWYLVPGIRYPCTWFLVFCNVVLCILLHLVHILATGTWGLVFGTWYTLSLHLLLGFFAISYFVSWYIRYPCTWYLSMVMAMVRKTLAARPR